MECGSWGYKGWKKMVKIEDMEQAKKKLNGLKKRQRKQSKWQKRWLVIWVFGIVMMVFLGSWLWFKIEKWWEGYKAMNTVIEVK